MAWLSLLLVALSAVSRVASRPLTARTVTAPSADPFYTPPAGYASTAAGTILDSRTIDASFFGLVPDLVEAWELLYRTTAVNGTAIATVTTVFKPILGAQTDRFVSFQAAYDSSSTTCDPSYTYQLGASQTDLITSVEFLLLQGLLISGYIVASPDYEGPDAAFGPGRLEGMAVLDGMKAVQNFASTLGLDADAKVVGYGYSGGAIATGWAASLQSSYGSNINIQGWAQGGTPANLTGTLVYLDGTVFSGFLPAALDGLLKPSAYQAELQPLIDSVATTKGQSYLTYADENCAFNDILNFSDQSVLNPEFQTEGEPLLYNPTFVNVMAQNIMGLHADETPTSPVYMYHASQDEVIPYANASTLYQSWCDKGASVQFVTYASGGHITTEILGYAGAMAFISDAFEGTVASGCSQTTDANSTVDPLAAGLDLELVLVDLINALEIAGTGDSNIISDITTLLQTV